MRSFSKSAFLIFCLFFSVEGFSQENIPDSSKTKIIVAAKEIISAAGNCALITLDDKGLPNVRTMDPFVPEKNFTIWLGTNSKSRKIDQIRNNPEVALYYFDKDASAYLTIHGTAKISNDKKQKKKYWKDKWEAFYPNYPEGYSLIKVTPQWIEVISERHKIFGDSITWKAPVLHFEGER